MLDGKKHVLLAVGSSIAAYKAAEIARALVHKGYAVTVTMTENATKLIAPLTFETLTARKCLVDTFDRRFSYSVEHVELAKSADLALIAPATANLIGKLAGGICDDMVTTTLCACRCKKLLAPAMNTAMYENPIVQENLEKLKMHGFSVIEPASGILACGDTGRGKLAPVDEIVEKAAAMLEKNEDLKGLKVLVTAGPTREAIDPVRFITNHSSGKMGYAIAGAAAARGAKVTLISGPVSIKAPSGVKLVDIVSAADMANAVGEHFPECDVLIMAAAVADYRPAEVHDQKVKKKDGDLSIKLERTADVLAAASAGRRDGQFVCGFSMETENVLENSRQKLVKKGLDMIAANSISEAGAGFAVDTNHLTLITADGTEDIPMMSKAEAADRLLSAIAARIKK